MLVMVMGAMVAVSVSIFRSYQKSRAIKRVTEDINFALSSVAKDVRMGRIENGNGYATGSASSYLLVSRNSGGRVCYKIDSATIGMASLASGNDCSGLTYTNVVDLAGTEMTFDAATSKFRSCVTDQDGTGTACNGVSEKRRGWAEVNINIRLTSGQEMETDTIRVQTIVSSRDYGW